MATKLLSTNAKLSKIPGSNEKFLIRGLSMAPHKMSGKNVCPWAGFCALVCVLWFAGRTVMENVRRAMIARTELFFTDRPEFLRQLYRELTALQRAADKAGATAAVRLNTASDVVWERVAPQIFRDFPRISFWDYTKAPATVRPTTPANYELVHSVSERTTWADVVAALDLGRNIVIVFNSIYKPQQGEYGALPAVVTLQGPAGETIEIETTDGDVSDPRFLRLDGVRRAIVLRGKGGADRVAQAVAAGFAHDAGAVGRIVSSEFRREGSAVVKFAK